MNDMAQSPAGLRIRTLLDAGSFVEIGAAVTARSTDFDLVRKKMPSDGVLTGYGQINGHPVYVYSQDASVLKGTVGEMHAAKIVHLYELAMKTGDPVIGLIDCAGVRLEEGMDGLHAFGTIFRAQTNASGVIPQITAVFGTCGGGMTVSAALSDFTFIENRSGKMFFHAPNAIPGNHEEVCDTSDAEFQYREAGTADVIGTQTQIFAHIRRLISLLPANNEDLMGAEEVPDDLNRIQKELAQCVADPALILPRISDDGRVFEARSGVGRDMVTALIRLNGCTVGVIANRSVLYGPDGQPAETFGAVISAKGAEKAARFVTFCDAFSIPIVTLTNACGFETTLETERLLPSAAAKLVYAFTDANTPKVNVITGAAYGSAGLIMNSRSVGADIVFAWEGARIGVMEAASAARILYPDAGPQKLNEMAGRYEELQNSAASAAARGYVDTVISPAETRKYLIGAMDMLMTKRESRPLKKHGAF